MDATSNDGTAGGACATSMEAIDSAAPIPGKNLFSMNYIVSEGTLGVRVIAGAQQVNRHVGFVAHHRAVMPGHNIEHVAWIQFVHLSVVHCGRSSA
jgi:hypothetical protein